MTGSVRVRLARRDRRDVGASRIVHRVQVPTRGEIRPGRDAWQALRIFVVTAGRWQGDAPRGFRVRLARSAGWGNAGNAVQRRD